MVRGGEVTGVEVTHGLEAIVGGIGVPLGGAGPGLLGRASVVGPGLGEGKVQGFRRDAAAAIVVTVGGPWLGRGSAAKDEES